MAVRTTNCSSPCPGAQRSQPGLQVSRSPKSVRSGTAEITRQQYRFWGTMAESGHCLSADGNISQSGPDFVPGQGSTPGTEDQKLRVTFHKLQRRMVYELTNWSNSATAAHVFSSCAANRS